MWYIITSRDCRNILMAWFNYWSLNIQAKKYPIACPKSRQESFCECAPSMRDAVGNVHTQKRIMIPARVGFLYFSLTRFERKHVILDGLERNLAMPEGSFAALPSQWNDDFVLTSVISLACMTWTRMDGTPSFPGPLRYKIFPWSSS